MFARTQVRSLVFALAWCTWPGLPSIIRPPLTDAARTAAPADTEQVVAVVTPPGDTLSQLVEFHRHARSNHLGFFVDESQMAALRTEYASDALRRVPGVTVRPSGRIGNQIRIRGCAPLVWVDRQRVPGAELDEVAHGGDVAAIEVYRSQSGVPAEFTDRTATCGTIVVWLKTG